MTCRVCGKRAYSEYCVAHKPRKALRARVRPKKMSVKEKDYQEWKEAVARPYVVQRDNNECACCGRPAYPNEKLDLDHIKGKGSSPKDKRNLHNIQLLCRPCHFNKTNHYRCEHA